MPESARQPERSRPLAWARAHPGALVLVGYLLIALFTTALLWVDPAGRRQIGDVQDVNQAAWFMRYAATAISHFRLPALTTTVMNSPAGVNMMWNTSFLLLGVLFAPVTLLFGPQVSLTTVLVVGFAGSAATMFYVLRHWRCSTAAAALGGLLYGFSPALVNSGLGHYSLVFAVIPPLLIDRLLRIVTGQGSAVRNGLWLGVLAAAQVFISEEALVDTAIAAVLLLAVLAISRPREVVGRIRETAIGLGVAAVAGLVLCARGFWVQFHGIPTSAVPPVAIHYNGRLTNLGTLPYSFVTPSNTALLHTPGTAGIAAHYPQPFPEYLGYLGVPLIIVLLAAIVYFWRDLTIRVAGLLFLLLEWLGMGAKPLIPDAGTLPGFLLPWTYLQHLPVLSGMVPDRLCIVADAAAAVVIACALDRARSGARRFASLQHPARVAVLIAVVALLPVFPAPYRQFPVGGPPAGWQATFTALHVTASEPVLLAPYPWSGTSQVMRWQADTSEPGTMIGGDFIAPGQPGRTGRGGRAGLTATGIYMNALYAGQSHAPAPSTAQIEADLARTKPVALVADAPIGSPLGRFLVRTFGPPTTQIGAVLGWRLRGTG